MKRGRRFASRIATVSTSATSTSGSRTSRGAMAPPAGAKTSGTVATNPSSAGPEAGLIAPTGKGRPGAAQWRHRPGFATSLSMTTVFPNPQALVDAVGTDLGTTDWVTITQD